MALARDETKQTAFIYRLQLATSVLSLWQYARHILGRSVKWR